jgi:hypothetical protein
MLEAWINAVVPVAMEVPSIDGDRKMVPPIVMASTTWSTPSGGNNAPTCSIDTPLGDTTINVGESITYTGTATDGDGTIASYSWDFDGVSPLTSSVEDPGAVSYSSAGTYITSFSALDNDGANCATVTVVITVNGGQTACGDYSSKGDCNNDASCAWSGSPKNGVCAEIPPQSDCSGLDKTSCNAEATCQWSNKDKLCVIN